MKHSQIHIFAISEGGRETAGILHREIPGSLLFTEEIKLRLTESFRSGADLLFIGAAGICIRMIAPLIRNKYTDPAVVCIDAAGKFAISLLSGHIGGANRLAQKAAGILGGIPVITTQSDTEDLWPLDTLPEKFGWKAETAGENMNRIISRFVRRESTALLLESRDRGSLWMESNLPEHVTVIYDRKEIDPERFSLLIAVTPKEISTELPLLHYIPAVLHLGIGCRRRCDPEGIPQYIAESLRRAGFSPQAVASLATISLKQDEPLLGRLQQQFRNARTEIFTADELKDIPVPNPSEKAFEVTGVYGVAESSALRSSDGGELILEKTKGKLKEGADFTFAAAVRPEGLRKGHIEIVGAGPGDPELISVRGKRFMENADLILYAGSLVPEELTRYAKPGATVRSSASMHLEEQFSLMKTFYDRGLLIVRLHTGDPCLYGAIEEQMALFDRHGMHYHITPGISAFQAAAAALKSQFTIPEKVQTIILTRGEGRTPMPEREQLHRLAASRSTMCIYLSAAIADKVQEELLQCYPPETPVAICHKLTWKEEKIYRAQLKDLAGTVKAADLTLTTLLVVGEAIGNREGLSRLYADEFKHLYRK